MMKIPFDRHLGMIARLTICVLVSLCAIALLALWSLESWHRPARLLNVGEVWLLLTALVAVILAVIAWPGVIQRGFWWRRAVIICVLLPLAVATAIFSGREIAVRDLMRHEMIFPKMIIPNLETSSFVATHEGDKLPLLQRWFNEMRWALPSHSEKDYRVLNEPLEYLVETSRWPVRRDFMKRLMRDEKGASLLVQRWHLLFPAVIGQDVTLARRKESLKWLYNLATDKTAPQASRDAATFWMGLIVLTDTDSFAQWRARVRDAMFACDDPPLSYSGDVWMRLLDVLLAFDDSDEVVNLTSKLKGNSMLHRRALRERVRGMEGHMGPVIDEIEREDALGTMRAPTAMWVDLKHLADRMGDSPDRTGIQNRLRTLMVKWLMEDSLRVRERFSPPPNHASLAADILIELSAEDRSQLADHAHSMLQDTTSDHDNESNRNHLPINFEHALLIRNFLDAGRRVKLSQAIAESMMGGILKRKNDAKAHPAMAIGDLLGLCVIWNDLEEKMKHEIGDTARLHMSNMNWQKSEGRQFSRTFSQMYFVHAHAGFPPQEQLILAAHAEGRMMNISVYPECWWALETSWSPPDFSESVIELFVREFETKDETHPDPSQNRDEADALSFPPANLRWLGLAKSYTKRNLSFREGLLACLIEFGLADPGLLQDNLPKALMARPHLADVLLRSPEKARLSPWFDDKEKARMILAIHDQSPLHRNLSGLGHYLDVNPPPQPVREMIHRHFMRQTSSKDRTTRLAAFRMLLSMESSMNPKETTKVRETFRVFIQRDRPTQDDLSFSFSKPRLHDRKSWISWRDDALSAEYGWREQVASETGYGRLDETMSREDVTVSGGIFQHLMFSCNVFHFGWGIWEIHPHPIDFPISARAWLTKPPELPLKPTAWQQARALYLRRSDLTFPERVMFRPHQRYYR